MNRLIVLQRNRVVHEQGRVRGAALLLASVMRRLAEECEKDDPLVDSIGVVQALGSQVDAACGRYRAARDALEEMIAHAE